MCSPGWKWPCCDLTEQGLLCSALLAPALIKSDLSALCCCIPWEISDPRDWARPNEPLERRNVPVCLLDFEWVYSRKKHQVFFGLECTQQSWNSRTGARGMFLTCILNCSLSGAGRNGWQSLRANGCLWVTASTGQPMPAFLCEPGVGKGFG